MNHPLITTLIPTYRRPELLKRAISSALAQTYPHIQIQVCDNASQDETEAVVRKFMKQDARVQYHCHPQNIGMIGNYQWGLSQIKTPYFSFLSDDDILCPWFYEEVLRGFQNHPECGFSAGSAIIMSEKGKAIRVPLDLWKKEGFLTAPDALLEMIAKYPIPTCILFHRKVISEIFIDMNNSLTWDCDFLIQIAARYPIFISKRPCGIFLHHTSSYSKSQELENWKCSWNKVAERINSLNGLEPEVKGAALQLVKLDIKTKDRALIFRALLDKKFQDAIEHARSFRENYGSDSKAWLFLIVTRACLWFPAVVILLKLFYQIRKQWNQRPYRSYEQYAKWMK